MIRVVEDEVEITSTSLSGWYVLYPPSASSPRLIYHREGSLIHEGYSSKKTVNCQDPQSHLVGRCEFFFGCVEDLPNSYGSGENNLGAGWNNLNNLAGRFKTPVPNLYKQKEVYAFLKSEGFFKDEVDLTDAYFGKLSIRNIPTSKLIPHRAFGQPLEGIWQDLGTIEQFQLENAVQTILGYAENVLTSTEREFRIDWEALVAGTSVYLNFDRVVLGKVLTSDVEYAIEMRGKTVKVTCISSGIAGVASVRVRLIDGNDAVLLGVSG